MSKRQPPVEANPPSFDDVGLRQAFNPVSKWEEYVEVPGLTLFDIHREPRRVNGDPNARVRAPLKVCDISSVFICNVAAEDNTHSLFSYHKCFVVIGV